MFFALFVQFSGGKEIISVTALTEEEKKVQEELGNQINDLLSALDLEELQKYLDSLSQFGGISVKDKLASVINGDFSLDYSSLGETVLHLVWE